MNRMRALTIWLASLFLLVCGCRYLPVRHHDGKPGMVDGPEFIDGALVSTENASFDTIYKAGAQALHELKITVVERNKAEGTLVGRTTDNKLVHVHLKAHGGETEIRIQVAGETEQARARMILDQIRKQVEIGL